MGKDTADVPLTPVDGGDYNGSNNASANKKKGLLAHLALAFLLINVIVLYILHFADRGHSSSTDAVTGKVSTSSALAATSTSASEGQAVSFTSDGKLTAGAGTSAYLAAATLPADKSLQYIHFARLGVSEETYSTNLLSYQQGVSPDLESVLTVFTSDATTKKITIANAADANVISGATIKGLTTLSDSLAAVLTTITGADGLSTTVYVTPATIAEENVELLQDKRAFAVNNSATNFIARISDSTFAVAYYEPYSATEAYYQGVKVGSVDSDSKISFSEGVTFGNANGALSTTIGHPQSVFNTSDTVAIPWFVDDSSATSANQTIDGSVGLCVFTARYDGDAVKSLGDVCDTSFQPAYFVDSTQVSETVLAFSFFDRANNFALTIVTMEFSDITSTATFRSSYVVEEASGAFDFGSAYGFYPQPAVRVLSDSKVAISFLNPSNSGKPSVKVLKLYSDLSIEDASPVLPISNADFSIASADPNAYGGIVLDVLPVESGCVVGYAGLWAGVQNQRITMVESYSKPVGVVSDVDGSDINVALTGAVDVDDLVTGTAYYASTEGTLYAASTTTSDDYILANDNTIVISKDSLVGIAISSDKLFVTSQSS